MGDLARLERFTMRFFKAEGREPTRKWYIVSQRIGLDPGTRHPVLSTNKEELEDFAGAGGLAIDTSELFRLWMAVRSGEVTQEEARKALMTATGRFVHGVAESEENQPSQEPVNE